MKLPTVTFMFQRRLYKVKSRTENIKKPYIIPVLLPSWGQRESVKSSFLFYFIFEIQEAASAFWDPAIGHYKNWTSTHSHMTVMIGSKWPPFPKLPTLGLSWSVSLFSLTEKSLILLPSKIFYYQHKVCLLSRLILHILHKDVKMYISTNV